MFLTRSFSIGISAIFQSMVINCLSSFIISEASSSAESSTEEEGWESGELMALVPQYYPKSDNYYYGSCTSSSSFNNNNNNKSNLNDTSNNISNNSNSITKAVTASSKDLEKGDTIKTNQNPIESNDSNNLNQLTTTSTSNSNNGKIILNSQLTTLSPSLSSPTSSSSSPSQRAKTKQFKTKSNNIKSNLSTANNQYGSSPNAGSHPLKIICAKTKANKLRWLTNMRSDPNLKETLTKSVKIRPSNSIPITTVAVAKTKSTPSNDNLLSIDYYSSLCDKQLSFESPGKSPGSHMKRLLQKTLEAEEGGEDSEGCGTTTSIVVAKQIEVSSDKIGFNVKPSTSQRPVEIMPDSKNQKTNVSVMVAPPGENRFCNRFLSHFTNSKKQDSPNDQNANDLNVTPSCLSPAAVPRINRCTPFSFREIRQELQSVMKSQNQKAPQQNNKH